MDSEELGVELARLINDTVNESMPDLAKTLGTQAIIYEYVAFLLWMTVMEARLALSENLFNPTIREALHPIFLLLQEGATRAKRQPYTWKEFQDFIDNRVQMYCDICQDTAPGVRGEQSAAIAYTFIVCCFGGCFGDDAEYRRLVAKPEDTARQMTWVADHGTQFSQKVESVLSRFSSQLPALRQAKGEDYFIESVASALKKDIDYLAGLGIKLDKGKLAARTGGTAWAGYEAFTGDWLSALVIGGISLLLGGLTDGYKRIKVQEIQQKWSRWLSELNQVQVRCLMTTLQDRYPLLLCQFQNLLQAGQG